MIVRYTSYNFNKPQIISDEEYNVLKKNFSINDNFYPFHTDGFTDHYIGLLKWSGYAILAIILGSIVKQLEIIALFGMLFFLGLLFGGPAFEMISYANYLRSRNSYYRKLKKNIIMSNNYSDFTARNR